MSKRKRRSCGSCRNIPRDCQAAKRPGQPHSESQATTVAVTPALWLGKISLLSTTTILPTVYGYTEYRQHRASRTALTNRRRALAFPLDPQVDCCQGWESSPHCRSRWRPQSLRSQNPPDTAVVEMQRDPKYKIQKKKSGLLRTIKDALGARNLSNGSWERYELRRAGTRTCHWWGRESHEQAKPPRASPLGCLGRRSDKSEVRPIGLPGRQRTM